MATREEFLRWGRGEYVAGISPMRKAKPPFPGDKKRMEDRAELIKCISEWRFWDALRPATHEHDNVYRRVARLHKEFGNIGCVSFDDLASRKVERFGPRGEVLAVTKGDLESLRNEVHELLQVIGASVVEFDPRPPPF